MPLPTVIETEPLAKAPRDWLAQRTNLIHCPHTDTARLHNLLADAQGLVIRTYTTVGDELLNHAPSLRVVARAGVGLDNIDLDACRQRKVTVVHTPHANTQAVVEYIASTLLSSTRSIQTLDHTYAGSDWHSLRERAISEKSVASQTLGIIGLGRIGSRVASLGKALSMRVVYTDLRNIPEPDRSGAECVSMDELLAISDSITVHVDGRKENHHLINQSAFARMKPEVLFINTSRGFVVDPAAVHQFAQTNPNAKIVLDVHDPEPMIHSSPLINQPNITLTPHIAAGTKQAKETMSWVVKDLMRVLNNKPPTHRANPA